MAPDLRLPRRDRLWGAGSQPGTMPIARPLLLPFQLMLGLDRDREAFVPLLAGLGDDTSPVGHALVLGHTSRTSCAGRQEVCGERT